MRPLSFRSDELRSLLLRSKIATLDELKQALGTAVDVTVFRKLKPLDYVTSYSHRGRYYTLREIARFDDKGLWSHATVCFSQFGTLLATAESFVNRSPRGYFADELARALHVEVQDALHQLAQQRRVTRQIVSGLYLYTASDRAIQQGQLLTRRNVDALPTVVDVSLLEVSEEELKASILLFYSLLDEQQRRLYAGLESLKLGRGGDRSLADFLDLDPHSSWAWKTEIQVQLCNPFGITATIAHYPTGASKWNPIEHRLFSEISKHWAAEPLVSYEKMLGFIRKFVIPAPKPAWL